MRAFTTMLLAFALASCGVVEKPVPPVSESGELVVLTINDPATYYEESEGNYAGLEYELVTLFARELNVKARFIVMQKAQQILPALAKHKAHFAAAALAVSAEGEKLTQYGPAYQSVQHQVAYNTDDGKPDGIEELIGKKIQVAAGTSSAEKLKEAQRQYPGLKWSETQDDDGEELLAKVALGAIDHAVTHSVHVDMARHFYPALGMAFNIGKPTHLAWAFPKDADSALVQKAREFFSRIENDGTLKRLIDRYYGHIKRLDQTDIIALLDKMRSVLPHFRSFFHQAEELTGIDWRLIAALGYQESHWDPLATSYTNVRGLMMLTQQTADRMKVSDRLDPRQNILAGARYLLLLKDIFSKRIAEPDCTWMALAAYNLGIGHVDDARILAKRLNLNPDSWVDLKKTLPLLRKSEYFSTLKYGFARGGEAVILTENIRNYYGILARFERPYKTRLPTPALETSITEHEIDQYDILSGLHIGP